MYASAKQSTTISGLVHAVAIALILLSGGVLPTPPRLAEHTTLLIPSDLKKYEMTRPERADAGGGGGKHDLLPATKGAPPKAAPRQWVLPMVTKQNLNPILTLEETIVANPSILATIPLIGDLNGLRGVVSEGPGSRGGIGGGDGTNVGPGRGPGPGGPGDSMNGIQGGFRGNIVQPIVISKPEPEYSDDARKAKLQGSVMLQIMVDEHGQPRNIVVTQGLGLGLDERAVETVKKWKFKPGTQAGKPIALPAIVQVTFRLL